MSKKNIVMLNLVFKVYAQDWIIVENISFSFFFFFERPTNSNPSTLGAPTGQTEYSESNPSPPSIPGKTR
ncbi:hypothetical protein Hanom_Chr08g00693601 [Helianthus anomalus]